MTIIAKVLTVAAVSALASSASAQIGNITSSTSASQTLGGVTTNYVNPAPSPNYDNGGPGGAGYGASAAITDDSIFFQAGAMAAGQTNAASSSVTVSFDVTNPGTQSISRLRSTIFESNFGFFTTNFAGGVDENNDPLPSCSGATLPSCVPVTFGNGFSGFSAAGTAPRTLATTQFTFEVLQDDAVVRAISGSIDLVKTADNSIVFTKGLGFADLDSVLSNFTLFEVADRVYAYSWDRTNFEATLSDILPGDTSTIGFRITAASANFDQAIGRPNPPFSLGNQIVSFACFADPVGRGTSGSFFIPNFGPSTCNNYSGNSSTPSYQLRIPTIRGDTIDFTVVPEPDTWAMLIIGFGLVGLSMRRGKAPTAAA